MKNRFLSILLAIGILLTLLPVNTFAAATTRGTIQGTVVDAETQKPVSATVTLYAKGNSVSSLASATADASTGTYTIAPKGGITAGQYTLVFTNDLYLNRSLDIEVTSSDGLMIAAATGLYPVGRCDGKVTDSKSGAALSGVTVNVYTTGGDLNTSTTTGADGKYSIETRAGIYNVEFVQSGYTTARLERISLGAIATTHNAQMTVSSGGSGKNEGGDGNESDNKKIIASGACGENLTWALSANGVLTISGTGAMGDFPSLGGAPWWYYPGAKKILSVVIKNGVTSIGVGAFQGCGNLSSIDIPDSVTSIGDSAFGYCTRLSSIIIPNSVTSIGDHAFFECTSLTTIAIPNKVANLGDWAFGKCSNLNDVIISNCITSIGVGVFAKCTKLAQVTIPNGVKNIGAYAFSECRMLSSVVISDSVVNIDEYAFVGCDSLTKVVIPNGIISIERYVFEHCRGLTCVRIPSSVTTIKDYAFWGCKSLTDIYYADNKDKWETISIGYSNDPLSSATIHYNSEVPMEPAEKEKPVAALDVSITLDPRKIEYSGGKLRFENSNFESKSKFEIPVKVTVTNKTPVTGTSQAALMQSTVTLTDLEIFAPTGFNFGWFGGGKVALSNPVTLKAGESWTSEQGYIRAGTWFKPTATENTYNVKVTVKADQGNFPGNQTFSVTKIEDQENISELADKAGSELRKINTNVIALDNAVMYELGITGKQLDNFKREILAQIVMSNAPEKAFKQTVEEKALKKVFSFKPNLGATTYDLPLTYIVDTPRHGQVTLKLICHISDYSLNSASFGKAVNIDYEIISKESFPVTIGKSGLLGGISSAKIKDFSEAAYALAEAEIKSAYEKAWGNSANEVATLIFGETVTAILKECDTSYNDIIWKLMIMPTKSITNRCPTNVYVYDKSGQLCGAIENNIVTKSSDAFELNVAGDTKYILGLEEDYTVKYEATDNGTMSVEVTEFYAYDCPMRVVTFADVPLTVNGEYKQEITQALIPDTEEYDLTSVSGQTVHAGKTQTMAELEAEMMTVSFTDVLSSAYYYDALLWAVEKGITAGTGATTFSPNAPCTRAQIVTFLWRAAGSPTASGNNPFTDVAAGSYYYDSVQWAVAQGITAGTSATTFSPDATCTRGQAVTFLYRYEKSPTVSGNNSFTDVSHNAYYTNAVQWAVGKGVTAGTSTTTFSPNTICTRAQIVTFLYRDRAN